MNEPLHLNTNNMKKSLLFLLLFAGMANAQVINFPDPAFKAKLLSADASNNVATGFFGPAKIDTNNDGEIDVSEAAEISILHIDNSGISDLTGISNFTSLQTLFCENNQLTSLDASALLSLSGLFCENNQINSLNVAGMFNLEILECSSNQLATMNVSGLGLSSLRGLSCNYNQLISINVSGMTTLENLSCSYNQLTTLSVSGLANLKSINCGYNQLTTLSVASLSNFEVLWCYNNQLTTLNLTGAMGSFHELNCSGNQLTALNIPTLVNLAILRCGNNQLTTLNTTNLVNLKIYECDNNLMTALNASGLPLLESLSCSYNQLTSLTVSNLANLKGLGCNNNLLAAVDFSGLNNLENLNFSNNAFPTADLSVMPSLKEISCYYNQLTSINVGGMANLEQLLCMNNLLTTLNLAGLSTLKVAWCDQNQITSLSASGLSNLQQLSCSHNQLPSLDVGGLTSLFNLNCPFNLLPALDVSGLASLTNLDCSNNLLTSLDAGGLGILTSLTCAANAITTLNIAGDVNLEHLFCRTNQITALDVAGLVNLQDLDCAENMLTTLDISSCINLTLGLYCGDNSLTTLFVKNGANEFVSMYNNPGLQYVCADESQIADIQDYLSSSNPNTVVSSYCSFTPGGDFNTVTGTVRFDLDNDGCDESDLPAGNVRFDLSDGTLSSGTFASSLNGSYTLYAPSTGDYTLTSNLENPLYFNITPATTDFNFPVLNNSTQTQNFCMTANGAHPDLEVVLVPHGAARPGFDATYQIVYKNKGNQSLSGTVSLVFDDARTDFLSAVPAVGNQALNSLVWNFANLTPFESRVIDFTLNINSPSETPQVNAGDILDFTAGIGFASADDTPADNLSVLHQITSNSMDPNIKTCLEGNSVTPERIGDYLHYSIDFENLGSAEALNVVVKDVIDTTMFDINSLQVIHASHDVRTSIHGNTVEFEFTNINLAPAAGDPPVGGHGTILFKIKTLGTLESGSEVSNVADIFFDYNTPIKTNRALTTFALLGSRDFTADESILLYPNPTNGIIKIACSSTIKSVSVYDIQGRILETALENNKTAQLNLSGKSSGIYFVKIESEKGIKVEKVMKK